jgi:NADH-quinone oxidoreductase subunit K
MHGQVLAMFVIAVAAAEAAVGLAIVVSIFRSRTGTDVDDLSLLRD